MASAYLLEHKKAQPLLSPWMTSFLAYSQAIELLKETAIRATLEAGNHLIGKTLMLQRLIHHENGSALIIDEATLKAAGLEEDSALFQIVINPTGGLTIQSVEAMDGSFAHTFPNNSSDEKTAEDDFEKILHKVLSKYDQLLKNLADR